MSGSLPKHVWSGHWQNAEIDIALELLVLKTEIRKVFTKGRRCKIVKQSWSLRKFGDLYISEVECGPTLDLTGVRAMSLFYQDLFLKLVNSMNAFLLQLKISVDAQMKAKDEEIAKKIGISSDVPGPSKSPKSKGRKGKQISIGNCTLY